jgi:hypothetical protein
MSDRPRPQAPDPGDGPAHPASATPGHEVDIAPIPGPNPPGVESPHDFVRRRMRELREAEAKKDHRDE